MCEKVQDDIGLLSASLPSFQHLRSARRR